MYIPPENIFLVYSNYNKKNRCFSAGRACIPLGGNASNPSCCANAAAVAGRAGGSRDLAAAGGACSLFTRASPSPTPTPTHTSSSVSSSRVSACVLSDDSRPARGRPAAASSSGRHADKQASHVLYSRGKPEGGDVGVRGLGGALLSSPSPPGGGQGRRSVFSGRAVAEERGRERVVVGSAHGTLLAPRRERGREGGGGGVGVAAVRQTGPGSRWRAAAAASGVYSVAGGGGGGGGGGGFGAARWRGFASANSPPEQYLRYIHRVKTEAPLETQEEEKREVGGEAEVGSDEMPSSATQARQTFLCFGILLGGFPLGWWWCALGCLRYSR